MSSLTHCPVIYSKNIVNAIIIGSIGSNGYEYKNWPSHW